MLCAYEAVIAIYSSSGRAVISLAEAFLPITSYWAVVNWLLLPRVDKAICQSLATDFLFSIRDAGVSVES